MSEESNGFPQEDYRAIWRELFYAILSGMPVGHYTSAVDRAAVLKLAAEAADESLEIYLKRKAKLREYNLGAFK